MRRRVSFRKFGIGSRGIGERFRVFKEKDSGRDLVGVGNNGGSGVV